LLLLAALFAWLVFSVAVDASNFPNLDKTINLLNHAKNTSDMNKKASFLGSALQILRHARIPEDSKSPELGLIETAITDTRQNNLGEANNAIDQAITSIHNVIAPPAEHAARVQLTEGQAEALALIKGDNAEGTGFLVKTADGPAVITNIHVISNNPHLQILTNTGVQPQIVSYKGATDRDLAMIMLKNDKYSYLDLATDVLGAAQPGDEVITPGNSQGGEVMLNTEGTVRGIGPQRVEFDNPIYHGNSGGPIIHVKSGKVIGVVTEAIKFDISDSIDKTSFANRNSAITSSLRYFGMRVDDVPKWEPYDWDRFQAETSFLDKFHKRSQCLDSFINTPARSRAKYANFYLSDDQLRAVIETYNKETSGHADKEDRKRALTEFINNLRVLANADIGTIQNKSNFYSFDQQRAGDEISYRKALQTELARADELMQFNN